MIIKLLQPYLVYVAGAAVVVSAFGGWTARDWQCKAKEAAMAQRASEEKDRMQEAINAQSAAYEEQLAAATAVSRGRTHTIREIFTQADAPPVDCAVPAAVGSVLLDAVQDANAAASGALR